MRKLLLAAVLPCLFLMSSAAIAATGDDIMSGIPTPPNAKSLGTQSISSGGQLARFSTSANPGAVISSYQQALAGAGWTVTGSGGSWLVLWRRRRASGDQRSEISLGECGWSRRHDVCQRLRVAREAA